SRSGATTSGGAGEEVKDRLQAQEPRPLLVTGKLFGAVFALAVMLLGTFGYFYLRSTEKSERPQVSSASNLPSAELPPSNPPLVQPPKPTIVPEKPNLPSTEPAPAKVLATVNGKQITDGGRSPTN